jgi:dihydroxyacetone kinase-like protein
MMEVFDGENIIAAMNRVIDRVIGIRDQLNQLDAAMGDGDTGITASKAAMGLRGYIDKNPTIEDLGIFFFNAGKAVNQAASSSLGTLIAIALMQAGKEAKRISKLDLETLARMLVAADLGIQERGKAHPGDKTVVDSLHPAAVTFAKSIAESQSVETATEAMLDAAREGRDYAKKLRSKVGRASWFGERTENLLDPGTVLFVTILEAILDKEPE